MINPVKLRSIRTLARKVLIDNNLMSLPVQPKKLAQIHDITIKPFNFQKQDISGCLVNAGSSFAIGYSTAIKSSGFQNFTIAHELGHYFIPGHFEAVLSSGSHYSKSGFISIDPYEEEADAFAAELLMPWKLIGKEIQAKRPGFEAIKAISESCNSSLIASTIKFCEHTSECVAAIVSFEGKIEFMTASDSFRQIPNLEWLRRGQSLPHNVQSAVLSTDEEWITSGEIEEARSLLSEWFPDSPRLDLEENIIGLGSYGRLLTILLAEWNPEDEEDDEESRDNDWVERMSKGYFRAKK